jgi:hypothetical protein
MEAVTKHPRLTLRGTKWYLRTKVPEHLRPVVGKREIWQSLGTSDYRQAVKKLRIASAEVDALFFEAEGKLRGRTSDLTMVDIHHLVRSWFYKRESIAAAAFRSPADEDEREEAIDLCDDDLTNLFRGPEEPSVQAMAQRFMELHGISFPPGGQRWFELVKLVIEL